MSELEKISSLQNPKIKNLVKLRDATHRRRQNKFLIEGRRELERATLSAWPIEEIYFCEDFFRNESDLEFLEIIDSKTVNAFALSKEAFTKASYRKSPDGWIALAQSKSQSLNTFEKTNPEFILILEGIEKPGNLGAIIRTANAAGIDGLLLSQSKMDVFNPNAIRASQGAFFDLPIISTDNVEIFDFLEKNKFKTFLATPSAQELIWDKSLEGKIALVLGTEDAGLSKDWIESEFPKVRLPMTGISDSLNVSVAAGIFLFETIRQRTNTASR